MKMFWATVRWSIMFNSWWMIPIPISSACLGSRGLNGWPR